MMIYRNDRDALAAHDNYIMGIYEDDYNDDVVDECSACRDYIYSNESRYCVKNIVLCRDCYESIKEV